MDELERLKQDISRLQDLLKRQEKLASLGSLTAGIAHEVQNPLNFVINFSKMSQKLIDELCERSETREERRETSDEINDICNDLRENIKKIQEHGERAISVIRGILLQSRGKMNEFLPTDVVALVHEYVWLSYHAMRANNKSFNVSIKEDYQENVPKLMVIPQDLSRAVLNVMNNACYTVQEKTERGMDDYSPEIKVTLRWVLDKLTITIADNGMGMTEEVKNRLYEQFFTTKPIGQGTGLGMAITHKIITENHKGEMKVESTEGKGSVFTFIIPTKE